jgi:hypothetical protein
VTLGLNVLFLIVIACSRHPSESKMPLQPEARIFAAAPLSRTCWLRALAAVLLALAGGGAFYYFKILNKDTGAQPAVQEAVRPAAPIPALGPAHALPADTMTAARPAPDPVPDKRSILEALKGSLLFHLPLTSSLKDHSAKQLPVELRGEGAIEILNGAAHFPGNAYLVLPHIPLENRPFAFAAWIRPEGKVLGYGLLEQNDGAPNKHLHILFRDPDKPYIGFYMNDLRAPASITAELGWTHLVFQFTGSHQQIWINGMLAIERVSDPYLGEKGETHIGTAPKWDNVPTQNFKGYMRDVRLYGAALTPVQIRVLSGTADGNPRGAQHEKEMDAIF